jgi:hypothetical protein
MNIIYLLQILKIVCLVTVQNVRVVNKVMTVVLLVKKINIYYYKLVIQNVHQIITKIKQLLNVLNVI